MKTTKGPSRSGLADVPGEKKHIASVFCGKNSSKKGNGAYWGRKKHAKHESNRQRRIDSKKSLKK